MNRFSNGWKIFGSDTSHAGGHRFEANHLRHTRHPFGWRVFPLFTFTYHELTNYDDPIAIRSVHSSTSDYPTKTAALCLSDQEVTILAKSQENRKNLDM